MQFRYTEETKITLVKLANNFPKTPFEKIAKYAEEEFMIPYPLALCTLLILVGMELIKK